jgi:ferredoxin
MSTLFVDPASCGKTGDCVRICPAVFVIGPGGYALVKPGADTSNPEVETAISSCSYGAIYWE